MEEKKLKIVLYADVLIHFAKASRLSELPNFFKEYDHIILDKVYEELKSIRNQIDNQVFFLRNIRIKPFNPVGQMAREYAMLTARFGKGESACMAYCKFTSDIIGSSNLKDIRVYCQSNRIVYLTTLDFLHIRRRWSCKLRFF